MKRRRVLTPNQVARQQQGGTYLSPGVWIDREGGLHFSVPEILAALGLPDTPADREHATKVIEEQLRQQCPEATVVTQDEGTDG